MATQLMHNEESGIAVPVDDFVRQAWEIQLERAVDGHGVERLHERLAECFALSLAECLDPDLRLPTEAQIRYATGMSRDLWVTLPAEALRYCGSMSEFIERFAASHKARRHVTPPVEE